MRTLNGQSHDAFDQSDACEDAPSWNFVRPDTSGNTVLTEDPELERYLVEEIARAKRRSPLMGRLAQVEREYGKLPDDLLGATAPPQPPPLPPLSALDAVRSAGADFSMPTDDTQIDQLMEEFGEGSTPLASAEWIGNARRARRRTRVRTVFAWIATLAIGAAIVSVTFEALQR